ncbi:helix-turn-helix domain-containing protein [Sphingopyxis panaciterrae]|uniref:helix-turn-helix domain-containing protein n=1 Tax=Sphingopyxis panaciterrae TaxID=363841 RepID=UPI001424125E
MTIERLTAREKQYLRLILAPMRAKEVAQATGLSVNMVNEHLKSARRKLGTSDSWSAARFCGRLRTPPIVRIPINQDRPSRHPPVKTDPPRRQHWSRRRWWSGRASCLSRRKTGLGTTLNLDGA